MNSILKKIREEKSISKYDMAKKIGVSRPTYDKIESDNSIMTIEIAEKINKVLDIDIIALIKDGDIKKYEYNIVDSKDKTISKPKETIRINIPKNNISKFQQVFLYIINKIGAKPNVGMTVLYKLLYFIDFDYYELYEEQIMGLEYIKNHFGPTPISATKLIKEMEKNNQIEVVKTKRFDFEMKKVLPLINSDLTMLNARELEHIDKELERFSDMTSEQISAYSHKDVPWIGTKDGERIDYEAVFYRNNDTSVRKYDDLQ
jgi:transcriptional regulator with XRE-family HTH domain